MCRQRMHRLLSAAFFFAVCFDFKSVSFYAFLSTGDEGRWRLDFDQMGQRFFFKPRPGSVGQLFIIAFLLIYERLQRHVFVIVANVSDFAVLQIIGVKPVH